MTITYSFSGNGNTTYPIGSLVDWHSSALIADQIQVLFNDVELVDGVGYEINEGEQSLVLTSAASGSDTITLNRVTPDAFFSTLETVGAASATSTLSNDQQLMNRIQEVEADIVVASANTTIQDDNGNLFGILKEGDGIGFAFNSGDGSLSITNTAGGSSGGGGAITLDFSEGVGPSTSTSFDLSAANTGFATTVVSDDLQAQINQLNTDLGGYVQAAGFNTLFDGRFATQIADYEVKTVSSPNGTITITENGAGNFEFETAGGQSVSSLQGQAGDLLLDMRNDQDDAGVTNRLGLDGCSHSPTSPTFPAVTTSGTATAVEGWSWIHDLGAGAFVSHKPLSGTRDSELIGDKTLTVSGTIAGDSDQLVKLASDDRIQQEAAGYGKDQLMPPWQTQAREGHFELASTSESSQDAHGEDAMYLLKVDDTDVSARNYGYAYPEDFVKSNQRFHSQIDLTGYNPRRTAFDPNTMTRPVFYPGVDYSLQRLASPVFGQVIDNHKGDTQAYFTDAGIAEPMPGSGNIRAHAPFRLFNVSSVQNGWTGDDLGHGSLAADRTSYLHQSTGEPITDNNFGLFLNASNSNGVGNYLSKPNMIYIPADPNGGIVTLDVNVLAGVNRVRCLMLLFAGMDEANKNVGPKESIIPVSGHQEFSENNSVHTLRYTMDLSDGLPRYIGIAAGSTAANPAAMYVQSWSLSRSTANSEYYQYGTYHLNDAFNNNNSDWTFTRGPYDPYVQNVLETYAVDQ